MENKNGSYECQYNPTGFDRIPKPDLNANSFLSSHRENVKFQFNQFFCPLLNSTMKYILEQQLCKMKRKWNEKNRNFRFQNEMELWQK